MRLVYKPGHTCRAAANGIHDDQNRALPVTVVRVAPVRVVQVKTQERDGYSALQVTYGTQKSSRWMTIGVDLNAHF